MKKVLVGLVFISVNVCGMILNSIDCEPGNSKQWATMQQIPGPVPQAEGNTRYPTRRSERLQIQQAVQQSMKEVSIFSEKTLEENDSQKPCKIIDLISEDDLEVPTSSNDGKKIEEYIRTLRKGQLYSLDYIKSTLMYHCAHPEVPVKDIADMFGFKYGTLRKYISLAGVSKKNKSKYTEEEIDKMLEMYKNVGPARTSQQLTIHCSTIRKYAKRRGEAPLRNYVGDQKILECYKSGGNFEDIYKIITSSEHFAREKFANVISKQMTSTEKKQLVDENMDIIMDCIEKLLTDKGRIDKYKDRSIRIGNVCERNFGECEDYLIRKIAHQLKYDLSKLSVKWNIKYKSITQLNENMKQQIINEYNKGFLTYKGIEQKYKVTKKIVQTVIYEKGHQAYRRVAKSGNYKYANLEKITEESLQNNFGYKQSTAKRLKTAQNQWGRLTPAQKDLFKEILGQNVADRRMPSNEYLDKIKSSNNYANEKFRKFLLILCNRGNEINMTLKSIHRLKRELEIWIKLAQQEKVD